MKQRYNQMDEVKQKVLIIHNYYQIPGGEDTVVHNEKKMLEDNGHEVILYTRSNVELKCFNIFQKILLPFESIFSIRTYREVKKIIKENKIDVVHVHNVLSLISPSVYYAALNCKVPVVQTIHNFRLLCPGATFYRDGHICEDCVKGSLSCSLKNNCYRGSRVQTLVCVLNLKLHRFLGIYKKLNYICLTEFNKEKLLEFNDKGKQHFNENKVFVKPNFIKSTQIDCEKGSEYFIYVGRLDVLKGINLLVKAWKNVDKKLIIVGKGPYEEELINYINNNEVNNIEFAGFKNKNEVMKLIASSNAIIVPSQWYEGFPMTIVESFSLGVPVIAGDIGNLGTLIEHGYNGLLFKYNDADDLVDKVNKLNNKEFDLKLLQKGALDTFELKYNDIKNYELLSEIYKNSSRRN